MNEPRCHFETQDEPCGEVTGMSYYRLASTGQQIDLCKKHSEMYLGMGVKIACHGLRVNVQVSEPVPEVPELVN